MSAPEHEKELAKELRLRPERPQVTRLSRRVLIALSGVSVAAILGLTFFALQQRGRSGLAPELYNTDAKTTADGLAGLPRDYAGLPKDVPKLGPPLPGDLGRPILAAQGQLPPTGVDPEEQRLGQEREAARTSKLFASTNVIEHAAAALTSAATAASSAATALAAETAPIDPNSLQNMQDRKLSFVNGPVDRRTVSPDRLAAPASRYVLQAGAVIPAALVTGIRSDLPGQITAQVTENIYDSPTGRFLLVPQGAKLIGVYDSQVAFGQSRVLLVWNRLIFPNGNSDRARTPTRRRRLRIFGARGWRRLPLDEIGGSRGALDDFGSRNAARHDRQRQPADPGAAARRRQQRQPNRPTDRPAQSQPPADAHHSAGVSGASHRDARFGAGALWISDRNRGDRA